MFLSVLQLISQLDALLEQKCPSRVYRFYDVFTALLIDFVRLSAGRFVAKGLSACNRPSEPLKLYDFEPSRACRKVRETLSVLDLDHIVYPCPRDTLKERGVARNHYRQQMQKDGLKVQFPLLVDPNTEIKLYESSEIVSYLWATYGNNAKAPWNYKLCLYTRWEPISANIAFLLRPRLNKNGVFKLPSNSAEKPLELWGYESSCFVRLVREKLSALGLAYMYHEVPMGSDEKRKAFLKAHEHELPEWRKRVKMIQVPYMMDPNTNVEMFESENICEYLTKQYQVSNEVSETWSDFVFTQ